MFKILQKSWQAGTVTAGYPNAQPDLSKHTRGAPGFNMPVWEDARTAAAVCPTNAISISDAAATRFVEVDYGKCTYCGECAAATPNGAIRMSPEFALAARDRNDLVIHAEYTLYADGSHKQLIRSGSVEPVTDELEKRIHRVLGRSLAIRQVDAGSCNGCELEINALNNPIHDIERLGIHFVASPRHADMLLVTGPVTRNMELALRKTYDALAEPKLVVAAGACGISGGIFGTNYATRGGVDLVIPVDVYVPGCPPRPEALLQGILLAVGRIEARTANRFG